MNVKAVDKIEEGIRKVIEKIKTIRTVEFSV